jgi:hypothetical protein
VKLAVMQPYLFPYIGYFQLIYASDLFLIYDDVTYIKQGYINRNNILSAKGVMRFSIPVPGASSNKLISDLTFSPDVKKVLKTIEQSYTRAPYFDHIYPIIRNTMEHEDRSIATVCQKSFEDIFTYLGIKKQFKKTSELKYDRSAIARDRLVHLCHQFGADCYINAPGGKNLYLRCDFEDQGIALKFLEPLAMTYQQSVPEFVPNLSIIDVLMNCPVSEVKRILKSFNLA